MFVLKFSKSRSKNYPLVARLAEKFSEHTATEGQHRIHITVKELFEKWDYFNLMFWRSINWVDSTFGYDGFELHGREDRTRIFYSLQTAHSKWLCLSEEYLSQIAPAYFDESIADRIKGEVFNNEDVDRILDLIIAESHQREFKREFWEHEFEAPRRNSDFSKKDYF